MSINLLKKLAKLDNICPELDEELVREIGRNVQLGYEHDLASSSEWLADVKKVEELVSLVSKKKTKPLPNSANIKYPLIAKACIEFNSRTYPELIRDGKIVKGLVLGKDVTGDKFKQSERVCAYMNYQLLQESDNWKMDLDRLLFQLALVGFICTKSFYDPIRDQIKSELCEYKDLIINSSTTCIEDAVRITHVLRVTLNDLISASRSDVFNKKPVDDLILRLADDAKDGEILLLEQHTFTKLIDDEYRIPCIVTTIKDSGEVLRIAPRFTEKGIKSKNDKIKFIEPIHFFTDYHFLVSPKGKFQSVGFGILMLHLNEAINTIMNQLTDAGQLANFQTGFIDARLKDVESDGTDLIPGEWQRLKGSAGASLKDGIFPISYKEPSGVLFNMLNLLIQTSKELSSSTEMMNGQGSAQNAKSGAVLAMIDQSMKLLTSIHTRVYRSLDKNLKKIFILNGLYLDPNKYINVVDDELAVFKDDFNTSKVDIMPVADPNLSSENQRIARYQVLLQLINLPGLKPDKITKRLIEALNLPNTDEFFISDKERSSQPPPMEVVKMQQEMEGHAHELELRQQELGIKAKQLELESQRVQCEILKMKTEAIKNIATAESLEAGQQLEQYRTQMDEISTTLDYMARDKEMAHEKEIQQADQMHQQQIQGANPVPQEQIQALNPNGQI